MGYEHALACEDCKHYLDLHKWTPVPELQAKPAPGRPGYVHVPCAADKAMDAVREFAASGYFPELSDAAAGFVLEHQQHSLAFYRSYGDNPWWPDEPGWHQWRERVGPLFRPPHRPMDVDLPLNIILDLGITSWPEALEHYVRNCPCVEEPELMKPIFEAALTRLGRHLDER